MRPPPKPLPLAPRPLPGEALPSWVGRVGARYDLSAPEFLACLRVDRGAYAPHASRLDRAADAELDRSLAAATRLDVARIEALRVAGPGAPEAAGWARRLTTWCPECLCDDVARHGEVYERAAWRLGCCVTCPVHGRLLTESCPACEAPACGFRPMGGRLRLVCDMCSRVVDAWSDRGSAVGRTAHEAGPLGLSPSFELARLVAAMQADLLAALAGSPALAGPWASGLSAGRFARTVQGLGAILLEPSWSHPWLPRRKEDRKGGFATVPVHVAFDLLGLVAAALTDVVTGSRTGIEWTRYGASGRVAGAIGLMSLIRHLGHDDIDLLRAGMPGWEPVVADAVQGAAEIVTEARRRAVEAGRCRTAEERPTKGKAGARGAAERLKAEAARRIAARALRRAVARRRAREQAALTPAAARGGSDGATRARGRHLRRRGHTDPYCR